MKSGSLLLAHRDEEIATLTLNRPERHNALVPELLEALLTELEALQVRPPRVLIIRAAGQSFSTGGDVGELFEHRNDLADYADRLVGLLNETTMALLRFPAPIMCAAHGIVCGGSVGLLLGSDLVLLGTEAAITPYYGVVGFAPDGGWTCLLPRVIGYKRTAELLFANGTLTPHEAVQLGLANQVVADDIDGRAADLARRIAEFPPGFAGRTKALLAPDLDAIEAGLDAERRSFVEQIQTPEALTGMRRFLRIER